MKKKYDFIFSIGAACCSTMLLRRIGFQTYSYPFDWVAGSDLTSRILLVKNDFKDWLNIEDLTRVGENGNPDIEARDIYVNKKTKMVLPHDFAYRIPLPNIYQEVSDKYQRRIVRLYNKIKQSKRVLALFLHNPETVSIETDEMIIEGQKLLQEKFPEQEIDIIYIEYNANYKEPLIKHLNENVIRIAYMYLDPVEGYESIDPKPCDWNKLKNLLMTFAGFNHSYQEFITTYFVRGKMIKKGLDIQFLPRINTIFKIKLYLCGIRFALCIGKNRENI